MGHVTSPPVADTEEDIIAPVEPTSSLDPLRFPATGAPTRQGVEDAADFEAQEDFNPLVDPFKASVSGAGVRRLQDEFDPLLEDFTVPGEDPTMFDRVQATAGAIFGWNAGEADYDKQERFDELTKGIPWNYHDNIMDQDNLAAAFRARQRILDRMTLDQKIAAQGAQFNPMYLLDPIELPLILGTGGAFTGVKAASMGLKVAKRAGLSVRAQRRSASALQGFAGGVEAGVITAAGGMTWDETFGWTEAAFSVLAGATLGTGLGSFGAPALSRSQVRQAMQDAEDALKKQVINQDPALHATVGDEVQGSTIRTPAMLEQEQLAEMEAQSIGASRATPTPPSPTRADLSQDPAGHVSDTNQRWADATEDWRVDSGWYEQKVADTANDPIIKATEGLEDSRLFSGVAEFGQKISGNSFAQRIWKSDASMMNWFGGEIFESANGLGRGRSTAAVLKEVYEQRASSPMRVINAQRNEWAKRTGMTFLNIGKGISNKGRLAFDREIRLELNARQHGGTQSQDPNVRAAADAQGEIATRKWDIAQGRDGEHAVDGFENVARDANHQNYTWSGRNMMDILKSKRIAATVSGSRKVLVQAMTDAYRRAGMAAHKDAGIVAEAVVSRSLRTGESVDTSVLNLMTRDGQDFMDETLRMNGVNDVTRRGIMDRLVGDRAEAKQEGFTKGRNDIDLNTTIPTIDGSDIKIVDLMASDLTRDNHTSIRKVSGAAALARKGITNRSMREEVIAASQAQQRSLGEDVMDANELRAMFTHFDGGGIKGWTRGGDPALAEQSSVMVRRAANVAFLGKLGLTQLGETGAIIAQVGVKNFVNRSMMPWINKSSAQGREALLKDVGFIYGDIGYDHLIRGGHFNLDDVADGSIGDQFMQRIDTTISDATYINGQVSGFNFVRGEQHKVAVAATVDKIFQALRGTTGDIDPKFAARMWKDFGLDDHTIKKLRNQIEDGNVEFHADGFVNAINSQNWDDELQDLFAVALQRNVNQVVQKSMAGEQDAWMSTTFLGMLAHLKTFPLAAVNKQARRHLRSGDSQAMAAVGWGLATATAAVMMRNVINGREQDPDQIARSAVQYSNMTGWAVMGSDTVMTILGLDDLKVNPYAGKGNFSPPALSWAGNAMKIPGAAVDLIDGGGVSGESRSALRASPFASVVGFSNAIGATK